MPTVAGLIRAAAEPNVSVADDVSTGSRAKHHETLAA
jgi:hypothetical protein